MHTYFKHREEKRYHVAAASILRMLSDLSDPTSNYYAMDVETDQSRLWSTPKFERGFREIWEENTYFRVPTREIAN